MKVSIITATYNSEATLSDTLDSVLKQDHPDIEHVIVDGASKDDTLNILRRYVHVSKLVSEKDKGIYDAMNKGISLVSGEIIGILNSDDFYASPDVISQVARTFRETGCEAAYGDLVYVDRNNVDRTVRNWKAGSYKPGAFKWGWMPPHPTFFVRRDVYEKYGVFDLELGTAADYELMLRFIHRFGVKVEYIPQVLVKMRAGGASNADLNSRMQANKADRRAWTRNGLSPFWFTLYLKPLRKISQFVFR